VITVTRSAVLIQGSRIGTKKELEASSAYVHLKEFDVKFDVKELDWLASTLASAQEMLEKVGGGIVSPLPTFIVLQNFHLALSL
jgi:hypothetical protein